MALERFCLDVLEDALLAGEGLIETLDKGEEILKRMGRPQSNRPTRIPHGKATCRVYGCLMCKETK